MSCSITSANKLETSTQSPVATASPPACFATVVDENFAIVLYYYCRTAQLGPVCDWGGLLYLLAMQAVPINLCGQAIHAPCSSAARLTTRLGRGTNPIATLSALCGTSLCAAKAKGQLLQHASSLFLLSPSLLHGAHCIDCELCIPLGFRDASSGFCQHDGEHKGTKPRTSFLARSAISVWHINTLPFYFSARLQWALPGTKASVALPANPATKLLLCRAGVCGSKMDRPLEKMTVAELKAELKARDLSDKVCGSHRRL